MPDGRLIEAHSVVSTNTAGRDTWMSRTEQQIPSHSYQSDPIVLGQVMTTNDANWSVFWTHGTNYTDRPTQNALFVGKHVGEDPNKIRANESIGYILIEEGQASSNGVEIQTRRGNQTVNGYDDPLVLYTFSPPLTSVPALIVASQVGEKGNDGSYAILRGDANSTQFGIGVDEETFLDPERGHKASECVDYISFSSSGVTLLTG
jgi:hypothetical protein